MASWSEVEHAVPELAGTVRARFESVGVALLASLRADGSPRISGIEVTFKHGQLWLGSMPQARKGADLTRDGRLALHAGTSDPQVSAGDAKLAGHARVADESQWQSYLTPAPGDRPHPEPPFDLFWVDVTELSTLRVEQDHLVIESWRTGPASAPGRTQLIRPVASGDR